MNENKNKERQADAPKTVTGTDVGQSTGLKLSQVNATGWKRFLSKKWVFPATYIAAAAIILALMWVIQDSGKNDLSKEDLATDTTLNEPADPTTAPAQQPAEEMQWPANRSEVVISMPFYDADASDAEKETAIVVQGNKFIPNMGIALSREDNKPFDVLAAMSGKVTRIDNVPSVGKLVEITHEGGLVTVYYSLSDISVLKGDTVKQGDVIAKAARNEIERELGVHLHFEVLKSGEPVNPQTYLANYSDTAEAVE